MAGIGLPWCPILNGTQYWYSILNGTQCDTDNISSWTQYHSDNISSWAGPYQWNESRWRGRSIDSNKLALFHIGPPSIVCTLWVDLHTIAIYSCCYLQWEKHLYGEMFLVNSAIIVVALIEIGLQRVWNKWKESGFSLAKNFMLYELLYYSCSLRNCIHEVTSSLPGVFSKLRKKSISIDQSCIQKHRPQKTLANLKPKGPW